MKNIINIKYSGSSIGEEEFIKSNDSTVIESPITFYKNELGFFFMFQFVYEALEINSEIRFKLDGLLEGNDLWSNNGLFSISIKDVFCHKKRFIISGNISRILIDIEQVDSFSFLINTNEKNIKNIMARDYNFWDI